MKKAKLKTEKAVFFSEPVLLSELIKTSDPKLLFDQNLFVGEVFFSGPLETDSRGLVQSRSRRLSGTAEYTKHILAETKSAIKESGERINPQKNFVRPEALPLKVESSVSLKRNEADGTDNFNLPRVRYEVSWDKSVAAANAKPGYYLVPVIEYYYGHTGGWFNGQTFGCGAGARLSLSAYMFDSEDGTLVFYFSDFRRVVGEYEFRSNSVQMSQILAQMESGLLGDLRRELRSL